MTVGICFRPASDSESITDFRHSGFQLSCTAMSHTALAPKDPLQVQSDQKQITIDDLEAKVERLQREKDLLQAQLESAESKNAAAAEESAKEVRL